MTNDTAERVLDAETAAATDLRRRISLEVAYQVRQMREEAAEILQAKHLAGKELAHDAVAYLFGAAETHQIEFSVGHENPAIREEARTLHDGYVAHLGYLSSNGAITPVEDAGLFIAYGTGRIIQRIESDFDVDGNPTNVAYRDSESQRLIEIITDSPKRLVAGA